MSSSLLSLLVKVLVVALGAFLGWALWDGLSGHSGVRLAEIALVQVPESGASNPVTSVLLNFRGYDTLLELAVLLTALLGIWSLCPAALPYPPPGLLLTNLVGWVVPMLIIAGGYLLWVGGQAPGGAFQAGALFGAAGVTLALAGHPTGGLPAESHQRLLATSGTLVFVLMGLGCMLLGLGFLTYPKAIAKWLILTIETAATLSIGLILAAAFLGGHPSAGRSHGL
ncbi:sodium:proton antiporter [Caldichromatium japonicum]|uniref:Sodium:proton antiporter n=1 Tax=Caldichromatium japonicum TaxID=2699430 RepID=A0A6G7VC28_9GAMM|nr:MnhB domain-containing protein [Caldichromatium japonicum]QIK37347.1 sodium:proton antiporter [Caldichromatium japonicum]